MFVTILLLWAVGFLAVWCLSLRHSAGLPIRVIWIGTMHRTAVEIAVLLRYGLLNYAEAVATYEREIGACNILWLGWLDIFLEARLKWITSPEFLTSPEYLALVEEQRRKDVEGEEWKQ